ncbi:PaaI family thioesterase [Maricaulis sp.]|uniref:PaaI family thioesterase n=1 Tax=Maricaulis sp. TaxID=1486257 RepID=UPI0026140F97|nr:PaaI family thioesterase [Maricaulis sp.]MDF1768459.1 PaaI family thioesterase [Maricaulis sp.]
MSPHIVEDGEFAGWRIWPDDPFEQTVGPFFMRLGTDGPEMAFRAQRHHLNGMGAVHGGCLMSFADFALFGIAHEELKPSGYGVTVAFTSEFISGAKEGALMEARGEVLRAGGSLIFVRGLITGDDVPVLNFSGTIKRLRA